MVVNSGLEQWCFTIRLLSECQPQYPIERYAWCRLGMPEIDDIGAKFVQDIGRDICINLYQRFLTKMRGETLMPCEDLVVPGLKDHYNHIIYNKDWDQAKELFSLVPASV
jgi:hypothetical protein